MHRARQHAQSRHRELRDQIAHDAARLMADGGVRDVHRAKLKAASKLGISDDAALPRNSEIEAALRNYQRLFSGDNHMSSVRHLRQAALQALAFFKLFDARLVGSVLDGTADVHSPVALHLYADDADAVARFLADAGIPAEDRSRQVRLDPERTVDAPAWIFTADGVAFDLTVLPHAVLRQAPLSGIDQRPIKRASIVQLQQLLADGEAHAPDMPDAGHAA